MERGFPTKEKTAQARTVHGNPLENGLVLIVKGWSSGGALRDWLMGEDILGNIHVFSDFSENYLIPISRTLLEPPLLFDKIFSQ